jgi:predicted ABC-type transport system involved in lysophospholipase L1 biosynthesis ATPase subunit
MIRLENVVKMEDGRRAVNGVSLAAQKGECLTVSGPPGSGKSVLARLIAGMDRPSAGEIYVLGKPLHAMGAETAAAFRNQHIGLLARNPAFLDGLTVLENVAMPLVLCGETSARAQRKAGERLKELGLLHAAQARPAQLAPPERHKAAVARAMIAQPEVLLLDDFGAELNEKDELAGILHAVCRFGGMTVLELTGAERGFICGGRRLLLEQGRIQEETI